MKLSSRQKMEQLMDIFHYHVEDMCKEQELNQAINFVFFLEDVEQQLLLTDKCNISDILYGKYYWFTMFLIL